MPSTERQAGKLLRLEMSLVNIRWFGVAFGLFQVWQGASVPPVPPPSVLAAAYGLVALLAVGNAAVWMAIRRPPTQTRLRWIGVAAFALDIVVVAGNSWIYSFDRYGATWVLMYVLPLEGAMRYQLQGAMASVAVAFAAEAGRELYRMYLFPDVSFVLTSVTFRVGVLAIIALVAGMMARSLARQAAAANRRAHAFEDLARRESRARSELAAFHAAVMAGIESEEPEQAMQSMADSIGARLGYESLCILSGEAPRLRCVAIYGEHGEQAGMVAPPASTVARSAVVRRPMLADGGREIAAPMVIAGQVIGAIHVGASLEGTFGDAELEVLGRLADQVALVAYHVRLHAERAETVRRLEELAQLKSDFVAITSHELRTPLTGIRGFASILYNQFDTLPREDQREYLQVIDQQSQRLSRLVEDLLVVSRLDDGRLKLKPRDVEVRPFVDGVVASFAEDALRLTVDVPDEPRWVRMDPDRVEQMLRNLIHNALKFSPAEQPVDVRVRGLDASVEFEVADRGEGIPAGEVESIFERFHQVANDTRQGVGLGLYITKRLVDEMGGQIEVDSVEGYGATFRFRVPQPANIERLVG
ncbi:MAG TPA: HAMP domain-containing sensor histidine kinase [Actinomycetota bacterium]